MKIPPFEKELNARKRSNLTVMSVFISLLGGFHLTSAPLSATASMSCLDDAEEIHGFVADICGGEGADCSFQCTAANAGVDSFSCECME